MAENEEYEFTVEDLLERDVLITTARKAYRGRVKKVKGVIIVVDVVSIENFFPARTSDRLESYEGEPIECIFSLLGITIEAFEPIEDFTQLKDGQV